MKTTTQDEYKQQQHKTNANNNTRRIQTTTQDEYTQQQQHKTSTNKNNMTMRELSKEVNKT